jgi:hypothetical protein
MQFSLRFVFIAMTVIALSCGFAVIVPPEISHLIIGLIWIVAISILAVGLFFARGDQRAFCIGAFIVTSSVWTDIGGRFMQGVHYLYQILALGYGVSLPIMLWLDLGVLGLTAAANGWLCMQARRYFER